jgi:hypothetical protein
MDVEGMELEILEGAISVLPQIRKIVIEWHDHDLRKGIEKIFSENNFELVHDDGREYGNLYFENKKYYDN